MVCDHGVPVDQMCWDCAKESESGVVVGTSPPKRHVVVMGRRGGKTQALVDEAVALRTAEIVELLRAETRLLADQIAHAVACRRGREELECYSARVALLDMIDAIEERYK
jgi:hypothetical protein